MGIIAEEEEEEEEDGDTDSFKTSGRRLLLPSAASLLRQCKLRLDAPAPGQSVRQLFMFFFFSFYNFCNFFLYFF